MAALASLGEPGQRLIPSLVDAIAIDDPNRIFYSITKSKNPADGFRDIDARTFARAVDCCAWYIEENLGRGVDFPTLGFIGPQDLGYGILILACIKAGYKLLLLSPRNALDAHLYLLEKTDCDVFLRPASSPPPIIKQILDRKPMRVLEIAGLHEWLDQNLARAYPYNKTFTEAKYEPFVVLHTSGSTGMPKPIILRHATFSPMDAFTTLPSLGMPPTWPASCAGKRVYTTFPLFHCAGVGLMLPGAIYSNYTAVLGPSPPSADAANGVHVYGNVQQSAFAPMTLVELAKDPEYLENLRRLESIIFGGGPCPKAVGDLINSRTNLMSYIGTTECGAFPVQICKPDCWDYLNFNPIMGQEYRHVSGDLYEQVIVKDPKFEQYQGIFGTFPDLQEWPMRDLYSKHPTEENTWLYKGRIDDIIVFSTGEKLNPIDMEIIINAHPAVSAALVTGYSRFQSSLLVEAVRPPTTEAEKDALLEIVWPSVEVANKESPSYARIYKNMVTFTSPEKPFLRAGKGTVQRRMTVDLYAEELDTLYQNVAQSNGNHATTNGASKMNGTPASVPDFVKKIISETTNIDVGPVDAHADLFELGLDSLQVTAISRQLNDLLSAQGHPSSVEPRTVYANPSIASLTAVVLELLEGRSPGRDSASAEEKMQTIYDEFATTLPVSARPPESNVDGTSVVLLTGSTGSLGSYILDALINDPKVSKVYCLNRGKGSLDRQKASQAEKGLTPLPEEKVSCLDAELSRPYFGLPTNVFRKLLGGVTNVIHNSWQVDFNLSIESFSAQIETVKRFIEFSTHSKYGAEIFFISSIGAVNGLDGQILEEIFHDWKPPRGNGYGQAKFVSERLLDAAAREADVPATVCRVGQVAGPTTESGVWTKREWLPSLLVSSKLLGCIPESLGSADVIDWLPVDALGHIIVELALGTQSKISPRGFAQVYHTVNPETKSWAELLPTVLPLLGQTRTIEVVPLETWVAKLRESASGTEHLSQNPALKILDFFEDLSASSIRPSLETHNSKSASKTLASIGPVQEAWVENWMRQWAF